jgi:hypothetical protein
MRTTAIIATLGASIALFATGVLGSHDGLTIGRQSVDRSIASGSFNAVYPIEQNRRSIQQRQITARLGKMVALMASRETPGMSDELRAARKANLERLLAYRDRGRFPVNYEHPGRQLPCFIDSTGAICAVGYLVEQTAGRDLAEMINREYKYATVAEMHSPALDRWIATSGFTWGEIATIQEPAMEEWEEPVQLVTAGNDTVKLTRSSIGIRGGMAAPGLAPSVAIDSVSLNVVEPTPSVTPAIGQARGTR